MEITEKNKSQFGYSLTKGRQLDYDKNNMKLRDFVISNEPSLLLCIGCGGCTATCTSGGFTDFNFRKLHNLLMRGEANNLEENMKKCMLCGKCKLVCPRGVNTRNVIFTIKRAFATTDFSKPLK